MKIGITMPIWIQNVPVLEMTYETISAIRCRHEVKIFVVANRLVGISPEDFQAEMTHRSKGPTYELIYDSEVCRSVAAAWNYGCERSLEWGADLLGIMANDVLVEPECLDVLAEYYSIRPKEVALWSGMHNGLHAEDTCVDQCEFSCAFFPPETFLRYGRFDETFRPAYFEDNDYAARVVIGGQNFIALAGARFFHRGSATIKLDAEAAHHVQHWFGINRDYFFRKWGTLPKKRSSEILTTYFKHPFNDPTKSLKDW